MSSARYLQVLLKDSSERELLAKDLLINVTHFFRDPASFDLLADAVIPELVRQHTMDRPLRVWVPACSTGEEAYSIAMLFLEQIAAAKRNIKLQVFASDIDADCVAFARNGIYPESIEADVTPARLARFFTKEDHTYQVVRELRETVVFTGQSLLADAPFSRLDLVSCRNLLIYLNPEAQRKVCPCSISRCARVACCFWAPPKRSARLRIASSRSARSTGYIVISVAADQARSNFRAGPMIPAARPSRVTCNKRRAGPASARYRSACCWTPMRRPPS